MQSVTRPLSAVLPFARVPEFTCQVAGCCQVFHALEDYEHHYHTLHRHVCSFCKRAFPSGRLLDTHILEWHDSLFQILSERQEMVGGAILLGAWAKAGCLGGGGQSSQLSGLGTEPGAPSLTLAASPGLSGARMEVTPSVF